MKKIKTLILIINFILINTLYARVGEVYSEKKCPDLNPQPHVENICNNADDILCYTTPYEERRSCSEADRDDGISKVTASEALGWLKSCFVSAGKSFMDFFTEFLPGVFQEIAKLCKEGNIGQKLGHEFESAMAFSSDIVTAFRENPGVYVKALYNKMVDAASESITNIHCLKGEAIAKKTCGVIAEFIVPPAMFVAAIFKGGKFAYQAVRSSKVWLGGKSSKAFAGGTKLTMIQGNYAYNTLLKNGYTRDEILELHSLGKLTEIRPEFINPISSEFGREQYHHLLGRDRPVQAKSEFGSLLKPFKTKYAKELVLKPEANKDFIKKMTEDGIKKNLRVVYFDVENSVQKLMNDEIFKEKTIVDAINNSFQAKFYAELAKSPELVSRLKGEYRDYKSLRIRLELLEGDSQAKIESLLANVYAKASDEFAHDPLLTSIAKKISPRSDGVSDPKTWFLAGSGTNPVEANMAARKARGQLGKGDPQMVRFSEQLTPIKRDLEEIERLRYSLSSTKLLTDLKVMEKASNGSTIISKDMLGILRKMRPGDFKDEAEYFKAIQAKTKSLFGGVVPTENIQELVAYYKKVDSLSPPLFVDERVVIDLKQAHNGLVSVDFAGIGVDNMYNQMRSLAEVDFKTPKAQAMITQSFEKLQTGINQVTTSMEGSREAFQSVIMKHAKPEDGKALFTGDDGMFMPKDKWKLEDKISFVEGLAKSPDPSKYRVTFVETSYPNGQVISDSMRSKYVVRAEKLEKSLRDSVVGASKIPASEAQKFISAIDYAPSMEGGKFRVILSGRQFSPEELAMIEKSLRQSMKTEANEEFIGVVVR